MLCPVMISIIYNQPSYQEYWLLSKAHFFSSGIQFEYKTVSPVEISLKAGMGQSP